MQVLLAPSELSDHCVGLRMSIDNHLIRVAWCKRGLPELFRTWPQCCCLAAETYIKEDCASQASLLADMFYSSEVGWPKMAHGDIFG